MTVPTLTDDQVFAERARLNVLVSGLRVAASYASQRTDGELFTAAANALLDAAEAVLAEPAQPVVMTRDKALWRTGCQHRSHIIGASWRCRECNPEPAQPAPTDEQDRLARADWLERLHEVHGVEDVPAQHEEGEECGAPAVDGVCTIGEPQPAPTADAVPWPTPVRVETAYHGGLVLVDARGWVIPPNRADLDAIAAALNRDAAQAAEVAALRSELEDATSHVECVQDELGEMYNRNQPVSESVAVVVAAFREAEAERDTAVARAEQAEEVAATTAEQMLEYAERTSDDARVVAWRWAAAKLRIFARDCDIDEREVRRLADEIERGPQKEGE